MGKPGKTHILDFWCLVWIYPASAWLALFFKTYTYVYIDIYRSLKIRWRIEPGGINLTQNPFLLKDAVFSALQKPHNREGILKHSLTFHKREGYISDERISVHQERFPSKVTTIRAIETRNLIQHDICKMLLLWRWGWCSNPRWHSSLEEEESRGYRVQRGPDHLILTWTSIR